jgi:hypothetical protein
MTNVATAMMVTERAPLSSPLSLFPPLHCAAHDHNAHSSTPTTIHGGEAGADEHDCNNPCLCPWAVLPTTTTHTAQHRLQQTKTTLTLTILTATTARNPCLCPCPALPTISTHTVQRRRQYTKTTLTLTIVVTAITARNPCLYPYATLPTTTTHTTQSRPRHTCDRSP